MGSDPGVSEHGLKQNAIGFVDALVIGLVIGGVPAARRAADGAVADRQPDRLLPAARLRGRRAGDGVSVLVVGYDDSDGARG